MLVPDFTANAEYGQSGGLNSGTVSRIAWRMSQSLISTG